MPYISQARRKILSEGFVHPATAGELNYKLTQVCLEYCRYNLGYAGINDVVGALECTKLEFYRRLAAPYEDQKIIQNGDVYPS